MNKKTFSKIIDCDILIIGSGLAGALAAIKCHQAGKEVVIVTKGHLCWGGASILCGGNPINILLPGDDKDFWMKEFVRGQDYIIDQEWVRIHFEETYNHAMELKELLKDCGETLFPVNPLEKRGDFWHYKDYGNKVPMSILFHAFSAQKALRKKIISEGIKYYERMEMTGLIHDGDKVIGAAGFNYRTGDLYLFKSKGVVLAAGGNRYKLDRADNCGEGMTMAYEAGAKLKSLDMAGAQIRPQSHVPVTHFGGGIHVGLAYLYGAKVVNNLGEDFMEKASPEIKASGRVGFNMMSKKEIEEGRGPFFLDFTSIRPEMQEVLKDLDKARWKMLRFLYPGLDIFQDKIPLKERGNQISIPAGSRNGGVAVDYHCQTNIPGLYSIGDNACSGIAVQHPFGGTGLGWALLSGSRVSQFILKSIDSLPAPEITEKEILDQALEHFNSFFPVLAGSKGLKTDDIYLDLLHILIPYNAVHANGENMKRALREIERLREEKLPEVKVKDYHDLKNFLELKSLLMNAEFGIRSELYREESRCGVRREDFPLTDNMNWLKWIIVEKKKGKIQISAEDVPTPYIEPPRIKYKPELSRT